MRIIMHNNQNGMILVLAMFMMALLSMIGIASMMTSTTDIEIATGEQQYVETFYRGFAAHTISGEFLRKAWDRGLHGKEKSDGTGWESFDTMKPDGTPANFAAIDDYTFAFRLLDPGTFNEEIDGIRKSIPGAQAIAIWQVDGQDVDQLPCPKDMSASECKALDASIGTADIELWTDLRLVRIGDQGEEITLADVDIDPLGAQPTPGSGNEFGSDDLGLGSLSSAVIFNIDARSRLFSGNFNKSLSRQALGFRIVQ